MTPDELDQRLTRVAPGWSFEEATEMAVRHVACSGVLEAIALADQLNAYGETIGWFPSIQIGDDWLSVRVESREGEFSEKDLERIVGIEEVLREHGEDLAAEPTFAEVAGGIDV